MGVSLARRLQISLDVLRELPQVCVHPRVYLNFLAWDLTSVKLLNPERPTVLVKHSDQEGARLLSVNLDCHRWLLEPGTWLVTFHLIALPPSVLLVLVVLLSVLIPLIMIVISVISPRSLISAVTPSSLYHELTLT